MSFLRARAQAAGAQFKQTEKARLVELCKCYRTAYGSEVLLPWEFVLDEKDECAGGATAQSIVDKTIDENSLAGPLSKSAIEIIDLVSDFQSTPQCPKRCIFSQEKWDDVSMLMCEELKRWARTQLYAHQANVQDLEALYRRTDFLGELVKHANAIFFSSNGSVNDALRTLLRHIRAHIFEERMLPQIIFDLERQAKAKQKMEAKDSTKGGDLIPLALPVGAQVNIRVPLINRWLTARDRFVYLVEHRSMASSFLVHAKEKSGVMCYGFMETLSKEFLFSSRPMTSMFHRQYGHDFLYCRYKNFKGGEKFVIYQDPSGIMKDAGVLQSYYNCKFAALEQGTNKIKMVKDVDESLLFSLCLVDG